MARKNKYFSHVKPYLKIISSWCEQEFSDEEIAKKLGVAYSTLRTYMKKHPELKAVMTQSKDYARRNIKLESQPPMKREPPTRARGSFLVGGGTDKSATNKGAARYGAHRATFEKNRKKVYASQSTCGICGMEVDFKLKYPHPMSACIDHIIPLSKGGHPSAIENMQLAHWTCNRQKSDKLNEKTVMEVERLDVLSNRILPQSMDWSSYRG